MNDITDKINIYILLEFPFKTKVIVCVYPGGKSETGGLIYLADFNIWRVF